MEEHGRDRLTSGVWERALEHADPLAEKLMKRALEALGAGIASAVNLLDVEAVIIGGGLGVRFGEPYVERIAKRDAPAPVRRRRSAADVRRRARRPRRRDRRLASVRRSSALMRAVVLREFGGPEVLRLEQADRPEPIPTEVLVRVRAAGINPVDAKTRAGAAAWPRRSASRR